MAILIHSTPVNTNPTATPAAVSCHGTAAAAATTTTTTTTTDVAIRIANFTSGVRPLIILHTAGTAAPTTNIIIIKL